MSDATLPTAIAAEPTRKASRARGESPVVQVLLIAVEVRRLGGGGVFEIGMRHRPPIVSGEETLSKRPHEHGGKQRDQNLVLGEPLLHHSSAAAQIGRPPPSPS